MKPQNNLVKKLRSLAKRSPFLVKLWGWYRFLNITSGRDIIYIIKGLGKLKLITTAKPYTMETFPRLSILYELTRQLESEERNGSFIECGVLNGGSAAIIAEAAKNNLNRHVWLFDSWEGFPEPSEKDIAQNLDKAYKGENLGSEERVKELLFDRLLLDSNRVHLVKGWFTDTIPKSGLKTIALLHLDCDLYESVKYCLEELYDSVIEGGYIIIDDYGYWSGCKEAVDEFINSRNLKVALTRIDAQGVYFRKEPVDNSKSVKIPIPE